MKYLKSYAWKTIKIAVFIHTGDPYGTAYKHLPLAVVEQGAQLLFLPLFKISTWFIECLLRYSHFSKSRQTHGYHARVYNPNTWAKTYAKQISIAQVWE